MYFYLFKRMVCIGTPRHISSLPRVELIFVEGEGA